jgi:hypothetical protein
LEVSVVEVKQSYLGFLVEDVAHNLARFDQSTGRFMTGDGWAVTNQDIVYPLALLYTTQDDGNPYYQDEDILAYALRGADAWRDFQYPDGSVEFVKVDGSKWGPTFMPWSMYHWLETYALLRDVLDAPRKARWEEGLHLAYTGIAKELETAHVHNIPTWKGMATFRAGEIFERPDWQERGRQMIAAAVAEQTPQGYWREHHGPTTLYNLVYTHAIGLYHIFSGDERVLPCLERATQFHIRYTYPDGRIIETIDGRVKYHDRVVDFAHATFSLFAEGRRYTRMLVENMRALRQSRDDPHISYVRTGGRVRIARADYGLSPRLASAFVHYQDGPEVPIPQDQDAYTIHDPGHALIRRRDGWLTCLSGIVTPPVETRWGQDRQNYASVWRENGGLIAGGGNSKDQPAWSTFVVGEGEEAVYLPQAARLRQGERGDAVSLTYDGQTCTLETEIVGPDRLELRMIGPAEGPARGQLTFKLHAGQTLRTAAGDEWVVGEGEIGLDSEEAGGWIAHGAWRLQLPAGSTFTWPVMPFNPYTADGAAPLDEAVAVLRVPLSQTPVTVAIE